MTSRRYYHSSKRATAGKGALGIFIFLAGFAAAMGFGRFVFPGLLYSQKLQPMNFSHKAHQDTACGDCHVYRDDGTYGGIPKTGKCRECHEETMGETQSEKTLVEEFIRKDREIPWSSYARQPDNVFFSHAAHKAKVQCERCHGDMSQQETLPVYFENRMTGYGKTIMRMTECEQCHVQNETQNQCELCHK